MLYKEGNDSAQALQVLQQKLNEYQLGLIFSHVLLPKIDNGSEATAQHVSLVTRIDGQIYHLPLLPNTHDIQLFQDWEATYRLIVSIINKNSIAYYNTLSDTEKSKFYGRQVNYPLYSRLADVLSMGSEDFTKHIDKNRAWYEFQGVTDFADKESFIRNFRPLIERLCQLPWSEHLERMSQKILHDLPVRFAPVIIDLYLPH